MRTKWSSPISRLLALALILGLAAACSPAASLAPSVSAATALAPEAATSAPATQAPPTASAPVVPSPNSIPATATAISPLPTAAAATPTAPGLGAARTTVQVFLIAVDDNGRSGTLVGCGDSAIPVQVGIPATPGVLRAALGALFSIGQQFYGESGLYNALYQSNLQVDSVTIESGTAIIYLSGALQLGGECDSPRVEAQIEQTALQFATVRQVSVFLNGEALEDVLSLKN